MKGCILFSAILFFLSLSGCDGCNNHSIEISEDLLKNYNQKANPFSPPKSVDDIDCYIDYSYGMEPGMVATSIINEKLKNFLGGKKVTYYKVGASDTPPEININSPEANFLNIDNFIEPASKLKVAVDRITADKNKVSVFITDFERVENPSLKQTLAGAPSPHPIDDKAWAQNNFKDWLVSGNQIDVFAKQFNKPDYWFDKTHEKRYLNWIYTIVFTPQNVIKDERLYSNSVLKFLNDEYQNANGADSKHFSYTANDFRIEQEKTDDAIGDANDDIVAQNLIVQSPAMRFEYYEFKAKDLIDFNTNNDQKDKRIINKIKVYSPATCFSDIKYGIKVYQVTQGLTDIYSSLNQEAPEVETNSETGKKDTVANKPIIVKFKQGPEVNNVFESVYNTTTKEIGIKVKPDFSGNPDDEIYQVDIVVTSAKLKDFTEAENVLSLSYINGYTIKSLGESIKYAMNYVTANMEGKVLYTVYIKIAN